MSDDHELPNTFITIYLGSGGSMGVDINHNKAPETVQELVNVLGALDAVHMVVRDWAKDQLMHTHDIADLQRRLLESVGGGNVH